MGSVWHQMFVDVILAMLVITAPQNAYVISIATVRASQKEILVLSVRTIQRYTSLEIY